jgi:CHAD domain-containing protein
VASKHCEFTKAYLFPLDERLSDLSGVEHVCRVGETELRAGSGAHDDVPVELASGVRAYVRDDAFRAAGLVPSPLPSKLHHALGSNVTATATPPPKGSAGEVVAGHLGELVDDLLRRDHDVREDVRDGVHKMRVATRRLRSALATYRPMLVTERTEPLRDELRWLGRELGSPRDAEVLQAQLEAAVRPLSREVRTGAVIQLLEVELSSRRREAHTRLLGSLDGPRYSDLLDALDSMVDDLPFNEVACRPAVSEVDRLVRRTVRRVHTMAVRAEASAEGAERDRALHEVRKAVKRSRYAAESAAPALGKRAVKLARRMKRVQDLLGEVQDSVGSRRLLREIGAVAYAAHDDAFTFGLLYGREEERSRYALQGYHRALRKALRPR